MHFNEQRSAADLPFARPLPPTARPESEVLRLADGYETQVLRHRPRGPRRRLPVLYVHGIQSHPGWFVGSAAAMADRGHEVFQVTRRGSGRAARARGHADSVGQLLDDLEVSCRFVLDTSGAGRVHLLGVSWGGKLLACYGALGRGSRAIASLTMVAPGIAAKVSVSLARKLAVAASLIFNPKRRFDIPLSDVELFTDNEAMLAYLRADPYRLLKATARFLYVSRCLDGLVRKAPAGALTMPTTLILARRDRIIDNAATRRAVERLTAGRVLVEELDGAHTLEFQEDTGPYYQALAAAMDRGE